ncbi:preprotein translocase subunit Sec61beta [Candidatus Pacearchaeota archaeon]|nr:preprotein translocase subunit Sec61beta [Candidatus Pacearchaeota archaeon]
MANEGINLPGSFGGLTRFSEEYESFFNITPTQVIIFVVGIVGLRVLLEFIY